MIDLTSTGKIESMEKPSKVAILAISGSGRKRSFNSALLEAAKQLLPENATLEVVDVSRLPLYNQDLEHDMPEEVKEFKKKIRGADAILFATPSTTIPSQRFSRTPSNGATGHRKTTLGAANLLQSSAHQHRYV